MFTWLALCSLIVSSIKPLYFGSYFWYSTSYTLFIRSLILYCGKIRAGMLIGFIGFLGAHFFIFMLTLCLVFMAIAFFCSNFLFFLVFFELRIIPIALLMLKFSKGDEKNEAIVGMIYFNLLGSIPFILIAFKNFDYNLHCFFQELYFYNSLLLFFRFSLIFLAKIPIIFFHLWLPKAHGRASGTCSMILARLVLKLGTFGMLKFSSRIVKDSSLLNVVFFTIGVFSSLLFSLFILRFFDLKYTVACSSVLHIRMITPIVLLSQGFSVFSAICMIVGHGLVSFFLFYLVTLMYERTQTRSSSMNKSEEINCKIFSAIVFLALFFNLGLPPIINFIREIGFCSISRKFSIGAVLILFLCLVLTIFFTFIISSSMLYGKKVLKSKNKALFIEIANFKEVTILILLLPLIIYLF